MPRPGKITGSQIIGKALQQEGVRYVFTLAGDHILPLLDTMYDMDFHFIDTRHEQAAVHMADAWGRIMGQPGVCMYTTAGFSNSIPGLVHAFHSESPVLSISGSAPLSQLGKGAMQEIEQVQMAAPVTKGAWMVHDARRIPDMVAKALRTAFAGRRGPVHLTIPLDVQEQQVSEDEVAFYEPAQYRPEARSRPDPELVRDAIKLLQQAQRPLVLAGGPAAYKDSGSVLRSFIETTNLPLFTEDQARGLVADDHPNCFGFFERGLNRAARLLSEADVILLLGRKQDYAIGYTLPPAVDAGARLIQVDPSVTEIGRNRGVSVGIAGDVELVVEQLTEEAKKYSWSRLPWLDTLQAPRDAQGEWLDSLAVAETPMHAAYVHKAVERLLRPDDFLIFDGGDFCHFGRAFHRAHYPQHLLYLPTAGMLGSSLPTALAAKLAYPESRVITFTGDGSFGFQGMEFDTAVRHNLPVVVVLGNDSAWGIDRQIQLGIYGRTVVTDLLQTRYDRVVEGLGGHGEFVQQPEELSPALERAFGAGRPSLVNVVIQRAISPRAEGAIARWKAGI